MMDEMDIENMMMSHIVTVNDEVIVARGNIDTIIFYWKKIQVKARVQFLLIV